MSRIIDRKWSHLRSEAVRLRGTYSFEEIGKRLGCGRHAAVVLCRGGRRLQGLGADPSEFDGLPIGTAGGLVLAGLDTRRKVRDAASAGLYRWRGLGRIKVAETIHWLGAECDRRSRYPEEKEFLVVVVVGDDSEQGIAVLVGRTKWPDLTVDFVDWKECGLPDLDLDAVRLFKVFRPADMADFDVQPPTASKSMLDRLININLA